ncbi:hypothetical protein RRG08_003427 [Elysia crispata]|uniref:glutaminyl-peptide cyclotransferase n=1 Tax=Elysia crispata TaxID=231223 RepID=A0AAE1DVL4_9GAST|nr:hypothetical protein RRG08_003427 [Elysia crispata]
MVISRISLLLVLWVVCRSQVKSLTSQFEVNAESSAHQNPACAPAIRNHIISHLALLQSDQDEFMSDELPPFLVPRPPGSSQLSKVRKHIKSNLKALNWTVEADISKQFTVLGFIRFANIIATQNTAAKKHVVLACHYDSKLFPLGFVGAMGSAVPCAMLVNLAKKFNPIFQRMNSDTTIQLVFFDGEEALLFRSAFDSLYGSRNLANVWGKKKDPHDSSQNYLQTVEAFILLDLIGIKDTHFKRFYKETDDLYTLAIDFETCLREMGMTERPESDPPLFEDQRRQAAIEDDHDPFLKKGVKNIMHLITSPFPSTWHTMKDNIDSMDITVIQDFNKIFSLFVTYVFLNAM